MPRFLVSSAFSYLTAGLLFVTSAVPLFAQRRDETLNADQGWIDSTQSDLDNQFELLTAAYNLDAQQQAALKQELQVRLYKEKPFEDKELAELKDIVEKMSASGDDDNSPEALAARAKLDYIAKNMPTGEEQIVGWVDQQVGPKAKEGRMRWEELKTRTVAMRVDQEESAAKSADRNADLAESRSKLEASTVPVTGQPLPGGEKEQRVWPTTEKKLDQSRTIPPNLVDHPEMLRGEVIPNDDDKLGKWKPAVPKPNQQKPQDANVTLAQMAPPAELQAGSVKADPAAAQLNPGIQPIANAPQAQQQPPVFAPAPPLDDWDKYVISVSEKYHFEDAQITKAQSILRELKRRANQYRLSRADELARAELITEARAREAQMKSLTRPLDAMFDELKQRLESLPTMEQRQKAAASPLEKKK